MTTPDIERAGLTAILLSLRETSPNTILQSYIWRMDAYLRTLPFISETSPGVNSLLIEFLTPDYFVQTMNALHKAWDLIGHEGLAEVERRQIFIPVIYGGAEASDTIELSRTNGLSIEQIARIHAEGEYDALCLGAHPGFAYLAGLSSRIYMPRKKTPSLSVKKGSIVIGGAQTGVIAATLPSGWNVIGKTDIELFDALENDPALIRPGDRIRFTIVDIIDAQN